LQVVLDETNLRASHKEPRSRTMQMTGEKTAPAA
jgi:hypothetical protein